MQESENIFRLKPEELNWKEFRRELRNQKKIVDRKKKEISPEKPEKRQKKPFLPKKFFLSFFSFIFLFFISFFQIEVLILILNLSLT